MEIFRKYLGASLQSDEVVGADIVDKLVDRYQSSTLIDDKRDALRTLKALSKKYRLEVGTQAMSIFVSVLKSDWEDSDSVCYALEGLYAVMNDGENDQVEPHELVNIPADLGVQFTEMYMKNIENYELLISLLDAPEGFIRRNAMRLLTVLSINRLSDTQTAVLQCRTGVSKLVDILSDTHEVLRNDVILLLTELTKSNTNIQKIVAFENAFDRLLKIIYSEGLCNGGVVVEDCLRLLLQLLDGNPSNQILFLEGNFIQRLSFLFDLHSTENVPSKSWSAQKVVNAELAMQVVQTLVAPCNKAQLTRNCQNVIHDCGLLGKLCNIVMVNGVPADVLTKAIYALADSIRGCPQNQDYLAKLVAPSDPPQSAINVLLISMVNKHQSVLVREAVLYCFQCYLASNHEAQNAIVMTLLPKPGDVPQNTVSAGQLLCGGLFSNDSSTWFCAIALLHCIHDNVRLKEELLRVHLTPNEGVGPVTLFHQCFIWQQQSNRFQTRMGLLQLLCTWFTSCSQAITYFLNSTNSRELSSSLNNPTEATNRGSYLSTLIAEVCAVDNDENEALIRGLTTLIICICVIYHPGNIHGFDKATLFTTLEKRIGIDMILERLSQVSKSESFVTASKKPQTHVHFADDLIFDYTFTRLFKRLEYEVMHTFQSDNYVNGLGTGISNDDNHRSIKSIEDAEMKLKLYEEKMIQYKDEIIMLRDRVSVMQSELNACHSIINSASTNIQQNNIVNEGHVQKIIMSDSTIQILEEKCSLLEKERNTMQAEQEDLLLLLNDQELKIIKLCKLVKELGGCVPKDIELDAATDSKLPDNDNQPVKENNNQSVPLFHTSFVTDFNQPQIPTTVSSYISGVLSDSFNNISMPSFYNPYNDNTSSTPHNNPPTSSTTSECDQQLFSAGVDQYTPLSSSVYLPTTTYPYLPQDSKVEQSDHYNSYTSSKYVADAR